MMTQNIYMSNYAMFKKKCNHHITFSVVEGNRFTSNVHHKVALKRDATVHTQ